MHIKPKASKGMRRKRIKVSRIQLSPKYGEILLNDKALQQYDWRQILFLRENTKNPIANKQQSHKYLTTIQRLYCSNAQTINALSSNYSAILSVFKINIILLGLSVWYPILYCRIWQQIKSRRSYIVIIYIDISQK